MDNENLAILARNLQGGKKVPRAVDVQNEGDGLGGLAQLLTLAQMLGGGGPRIEQVPEVQRGAGGCGKGCKLPEFDPKNRGIQGEVLWPISPVAVVDVPFAGPGDQPFSFTVTGLKLSDLTGRNLRLFVTDDPANVVNSLRSFTSDSSGLNPMPSGGFFPGVFLPFDPAFQRQMGYPISYGADTTFSGILRASGAGTVQLGLVVFGTDYQGQIWRSQNCQ